jgi:putative hydrolase of the HAD superfamily
MSAIRAVTFDVGGTLIDPWPSVGHVYAEVAAQHGVGGLDPEDLTRRFAVAWSARERFGYTKPEWAGLVDATFAGLCKRPPSETFFHELYERFAEPGAWRVYDDVLPALTALAESGVKLGIISNWDDRLLPLLNGLGLRGHFAVVIVSCAVGCQKPARQIFEAAAHGLQVEPAGVLHVGDSLGMDFQGARAAGLKAALLKRTAAPALDGRITSLTEVDRLVRGRAGAPAAQFFNAPGEFR